MFEWKYVKELQEKNAIENYLREINVSIDGEIVECLRRNNGGRPKPDVFDTEQRKGRVFKALLSYNKSDRETIYAVYPGILKDKGLFPVATDPAGNFICVDLKCRQSIVFFELESGTKEFIADTFGNLLAKLYN